MARIESWFKQDLTKPVKVHAISGNLFSADNQGNLIGVEVFNNGEPVTLSGTVSANVIRPDGGTVPVSGSKTDNKASVILPAAAYAYPGIETIVLKLTEGSVVTTLAAVVVTVYQSSTATVIDPGTIIPSVEALISEIQTAVASIPADYSSLWATLAPAYNTGNTYAVGQYMTYDGKTYRCVIPIATPEAWTAAHWSEVKIGNDLYDFKSALTEYPNSIKNAVGVKPLIFQNGYLYFSTTSGASQIVPTSNADYVCALAPCSEGDIFTLKVYSGPSHMRGWAFLDSSCNPIENSYSGINQLIDNVTVTAPVAAAYLIINNQKTNLSSGYYAYDNSKNIQTQIKEQVEHATGVKIIEYTNGFGVQLGDVGSSVTLPPTSPVAALSYAVATVTPGQKIKCRLTQGSSSYRAYAFLDENNVILEKATTNHTEGEHVLTAPPLSSKIVINARTADGYWAIAMPRDYSEELPWSGLYVSLLGDSGSALEGYVPDGNKPYYGPTRSSEYQRCITTPSQMWWYQAIDALGGTPLIIDAWSGSSVAEGGGDAGTTAMCDASRCNNLHAWIETTSDDFDAVEVTAENIGSMRTSPFLPAYTPAIGDYAKAVYPDIVLSTGGTNDWTYASTVNAMGTYDGHTNLQDPDGETPAVTTFREAYATMLCRIQSKYPFALIVCSKGFFTRRPHASNYNGNINPNSGLSMQDYSNAIGEIATIRACPTVDMWTNGFSRYNYYDTFAGDFSTSTTHANPLGHRIMAENVIPQLRQVCPGYIKWLKERKQEAESD